MMERKRERKLLSSHIHPQGLFPHVKRSVLFLFQPDSCVDIKVTKCEIAFSAVITELATVRLAT